jgi:hypothetical protein
MRRADFTAPAIAGIAFAVFAALYCWARPVYDFLLTWWGVVNGPFRTPFLDTGMIISSIDCVRHGVDIYVTNPCDALGRLYDYSPLWLAGSVLPITNAWTTSVGFSLDLAFLISLVALPMPAEQRGQWLLIAAVLSPMSVFAVERANCDIAIYLLLLGAGRALARSSDRPGSAVWRWGAYPLILLAGLLKFYPLAGLILSFRERGAAFLAIALLSLVAVLVFLATEWHGLVRGLMHIPSGTYFADMYGAKNLPLGIAELFHPPSRELLVRLLPPVMFAILGARALWVMIMLACRPVLSHALSELPEREKVLLVLGAAMMTGSFLAWQNIGYREIHFLMVLPGLLALARRTEGDRCGNICSNTAKLIVLVMWSEALRHAVVAIQPLDLPFWGLVYLTYWLGRELIWWQIIAVLGGILLRFALSSPVWQGARSEAAAVPAS